MNPEAVNSFTQLVMLHELLLNVAPTKCMLDLDYPLDHDRLFGIIAIVMIIIIM